MLCKIPLDSNHRVGWGGKDKNKAKANLFHIFGWQNHNKWLATCTILPSRVTKLHRIIIHSTHCEKEGCGEKYLRTCTVFIFCVWKMIAFFFFTIHRSNSARCKGCWDLSDIVTIHSNNVCIWRFVCGLYWSFLSFIYNCHAKRCTFYIKTRIKIWKHGCVSHIDVWSSWSQLSVNV